VGCGRKNKEEVNWCLLKRAGIEDEQAEKECKGTHNTAEEGRSYQAQMPEFSCLLFCYENDK